MPENDDSLEMKEKKPKARTRKPAAAAPRKPRAPRGAPKVEAVSETQPIQERPKHAEKKGIVLAVVMVRGVVGTQREIKDTLRMLRLDRINHCVIVPKNPNFQGMLQKARFYITWGEINQETLEKLVAKRGRFAGDKRITDLNYAKELAGLILLGKTVKDTGIKPVFRLSPPSKGYESTRALYPKGSLGYRGEKINELIKRMI